MGVPPERRVARFAPLFLSKGAQVNARNKDGQTPLDVAKSDEIKALLRRHGGKPGKEIKESEKK